MNNIFPFVPRTVAGDWTAGERARLLELADHLSAKGVPVEVAFGQTDSGDPWCVVTDEQQEVLVHVARIDGRFVIHDAAVDIIRQVNSLWGAVRQVLVATGAEARGEVVVAFNPPGREAQTFLALVIAVGFYLENHVVGGADPQWDFEVALRDARPGADLPPSAMIAALHEAADRLIGRAAAPSEVESSDLAAATAKARSADVVALAAPAEPAGVAAHKATPWAPPTPDEAAHTAVAALSVPKPQAEGFAATKLVLTGGPGADVLIGGPGGDVIHGGGGDDYIDGAGAKAGETDQLYGDAGDDKIVMGERVVATGGAGADTFIVLAAPTAKATTIPTVAAAEHHPSLLGLVVDFSTAQGDRVVFTAQSHVTVVGSVAVTDVWTERGDHADAATTTALAGARVGYDFDGDGVEDGFLLLGGADARTWKPGDPGDTPVTPVELGHSGSVPAEPALVGHAPSAPADGDVMRG
ncbi:MAG: hypothetical protein JWP92_598 [Caulobacter sp.]|nr:hypothetical protein [Caulobacter sp.]